MIGSDILIIGGGIAGLSAAAALSRHSRVTVLEAEEQIGYHSSGRSATMVHYALGDRIVRALTLASRPFFDEPPKDFTDEPLGRRMPVLVHAREDEREKLDTLETELSVFASLERLDTTGIQRLCPLLRSDAVHGIFDANAMRLDPHALLQGNLREIRRNGSNVQCGQRIAELRFAKGAWRVTSRTGEVYQAPLIINAAGSWADRLALLAGVRPLGLEPKRRTIITFDAPAGMSLENLPFAKTVGDDLYFAPESGRLFASPMDEVPSEPCDAQPDEFEVALAAFRMEERTIVRVNRIHGRWAGLRTFSPDRHPVIGFSPEAEGFFWLAGQGGFGLQTSPALAAATVSLIAGEPWPIAEVSRESLSPLRFVSQNA